MKKIELKYITKSTPILTEKKDIVKSKLSSSENKRFWELRGVNLSISPGEAVGLLGNNGAGKTILIDILAGKEKQTTGFITMDAHTSVATTRYGLDKNITGLENIKHAVSSANLDEFKANHVINAIINFSDLGEWLYCPVKTFSTGLYARLSIAIALFIKPELILIDNIFGSLDLAFFKKVSDKIQNLKDIGVSFVISDINVVNIERFCERTLWLEFGEVQDFGSTREIMVQYEYSFGWLQSLTASEKTDYLAKKQSERQSFDVSTIYEEFKVEQFKNGFTRKDEPKMRNAFYNERGADPVKLLSDKKNQEKAAIEKKDKRGKGLKAAGFFIVLLLLCGGIYNVAFAKESVWDYIQDSFTQKNSKSTASSKNKNQQKSKSGTDSATVSGSHNSSKKSKTKKEESTKAEKASSSSAKAASLASSSSAASAKAASESSAKASSESVQKLKDNTQTINVQSGDTLEGLASKYSTTVDNIMKINNFTSNNDLKAGDVVRVPK
ncbi:ATP-binding cassette domain-containing protein [Liquorilactobacillus mali]|uniref:Teichoic acid translocation ATP-binding protein n=1 Tax=Liquorilactobacillus mali KCTC 3596 = DSM 20444 TaxID=1046596 RepID=J0L359_9LACO|nr:ATP-binding cassette domain-containing protein [Liquorilactobacillus mali]EJE97414.1 Teichoic acid translocation ATP-binding protein [Liquorilactobacillus mali KCTC 3596 = DSM 20444]KRN11416.1 Teichoic acid translocation ATP-binding protein [Liquorilactobacillus mali KCTC 3596 = DSM 20444]MDC7953078.1 ATP-binding cassette domain-containing protein [Liquorilactobacillus mali]QFQ75249.1 ATP-binding cassette domain-containing protein [Liquorilactobacillus mali]